MTIQHFEDNININPSTLPQRDLWIDVFRVLAMLLIINGHLTAWSFIINNLTNLSCVYFFFIIAGYFSKSYSFQQYKKKLKPFIISYIFYNFATLAMLQFTNRKAAYPLDEWQSWLAALTNPASFVMWFLAVLITLILITPLLHRLPTVILAFISIASFSFTLFDQIFNGNISFNPVLSMKPFVLGLALFSSGIWVKRFFSLIDLSNLLKRRLTYIIAILFLVFLLHRYILHYHSTYASVILIYLSIVTIPCLSIAIEKYIPSLAKHIATFAPSIFFIFAAHPFLTRAWGKLYITLGDKGYTVLSTILAQVGGVLIFIICYVVFLVIRRYRVFDNISMAKS